MRVNLTYFKQSGKYYAEGSYETKLTYIQGIFDEVRDMKVHPGLSGRWEGRILIMPDDNNGGYPALLDLTVTKELISDSQLPAAIDQKTVLRADAQTLFNKIVGMNISDELSLPGNVWLVTRIPGGWIYAMKDTGTAIFVPYNESLNDIFSVYR